MVTETGANLSVLILTEPEMDWQTFATWYSFYKNLPEAKIAIMNRRNKKMPYIFYQWAKRLKVNIKTVNESVSDDMSNEERKDLNLLFEAKIAEREKFIGSSVLFVKPLTMAADILDEKTLSVFNNSEIVKDKNILFMNEQKYDNLISRFLLGDWKIELTHENVCAEAKEHHDIHCLITYGKGCGKWIDTSKGCPFSSAAALVTPEMTANEHRVIELWKKMVPLYNAVM